MKVLVVSSGNKGKMSPFVFEQGEALKSIGVDIDYFLIQGKGFSGYLKNIFKLRKKISSYNPDIVHAHYGLSGVISVLQRKIPVIVTYHGTDINSKKIFLFSKIAIKFSKVNIFVSSKLKEKSKDLNGIVLPCGVDFSVFKPIEKVDARAKLNFDLEKKYILFSSSFDIKEKNYPLAKAALRHLQEENIELIELKDYSREEVCLLLNAVDLALMTSSSEGSPQFIKEALACHCPIVSTDVGDVKSLISNNESCFLTSFDAIDVSEKIKLALQVERTESLGFCLSFDNEIIAKKLKEIYQNSLK